MKAKTSKKIRIALAQINPTVGAFSTNREIIRASIDRAKNLCADIIVFPELALCGYPPEDLLLKKHFISENKRVLQALLPETKDITAVIGYVDSDSSAHVYNAAAIITNGRIKAVYHKICLPNYGVFDEERYFSPGNKNLIFALGSVTFGISICEDIWSRIPVCNAQVNAGADILINISASPFHAGKRNERKKMLKQHARALKRHICYLNMVGGQDELVFDGGSFFFTPEGRAMAEAKHLEEDLLVKDLHIAESSKGQYKKRSSVRCIYLGKIQQDKKPRIRTEKTASLGKIEEIYRALVIGTRDYVLKNGFKKVVLGISGGIDSALVAAIACDALGSNNVIGITMPSQFSSEGTKADALKIADNLGIKCITMPIEKIYRSYHNALNHEFRGLQSGIAEENIQARIRGNLLMAFSNKFGWLVLTTGNKSETAVGYCTLYGDMAGGFAVLKDVSKTVVYELADFRNKEERKKIIPQSTINRPPSAELREKQKDQDSLPSYDLLDEILELYIEKDYGYDEISRKKGNAEIVRYVITLVDRNEYKRRQAPPGVKITPKAFGRDRRLPITNRYSPK